jgi:hypothetical protein
VNISRAVPNIKAERPGETRDFFVELLGFEVAMDLGWIVTLASPTNPSVQVTIISNDDLAAPGISVGVGDVDAVHAKAVAELRDRLPPPRRGVGSPAVHAPRAERHGRQRPVASLGLSPRSTVTS